MRHLKRNFSVVVVQGSSDAGPAAAPRLPLGAGLKECGLMDPLLMPPPWKRPSVAAGAALDARGSLARPPSTSPPSTPRGPATPLRRGPATPMVPSTPHKVLTPRVSWSEICMHSQESLDDPCSPPHTPMARTQRKPSSPPRRSFCRRRPPSSELRGPAAPPPRGAAAVAALGGRDVNEGRFEREFCGVVAIGKGQFSTVFRAQHRIDRCAYAVKKTSKISAHGLSRTELREVFALANVSSEAEGCRNIVRYYSSWVEDGRLHIQTELCQCSLRDKLTQKLSTHPEDPRFKEPEVSQVLHDTATGLGVLHKCGFAHLDVKPDNILVSSKAHEEGCYKIADLGLAAAAIGSGCDDICEGDCRYLAKEVLRGDLTDLPRADVFSLGVVCYELATNPKALPCNGDDWQRLRDGRLDVGPLAPLGERLATLLARMVACVPAQRPLCREILCHPGIARADDVRALLEQMRQKDAEAERLRRSKDEYYQEMVSLKRKEFLRAPSPTSSRSCSDDSSVCEVNLAARAGALGPSLCAASLAADGPAGVAAGPASCTPVLRRGKTS